MNVTLIKNYWQKRKMPDVYNILRKNKQKQNKNKTKNKQKTVMYPIYVAFITHLSRWRAGELTT